jgi:hypothetical protein
VQGPPALEKPEQAYTVGDWCVRCEREREAWDFGWTEAQVALPGYETDFMRYRNYCMDRYWDAARTAARK